MFLARCLIVGAVSFAMALALGPKPASATEPNTLKAFAKAAAKYGSKRKALCACLSSDSPDAVGKVGFLATGVTTTFVPNESTISFQCTVPRFDPDTGAELPDFYECAYWLPLAK